MLVENICYGTVVKVKYIVPRVEVICEKRVSDECLEKLSDKLTETKIAFHYKPNDGETMTLNDKKQGFFMCNGHCIQEKSFSARFHAIPHSSIIIGKNYYRSCCIHITSVFVCMDPIEVTNELCTQLIRNSSNFYDIGLCPDDNIKLVLMQPRVDEDIRDLEFETIPQMVLL